MVMVATRPLSNLSTYQLSLHINWGNVMQHIRKTLHKKWSLQTGCNQSHLLVLYVSNGLGSFSYLPLQKHFEYAHGHPPNTHFIMPVNHDSIRSIQLIVGENLTSACAYINTRIMPLATVCYTSVISSILVFIHCQNIRQNICWN